MSDDVRRLVSHRQFEALKEEVADMVRFMPEREKFHRGVKVGFHMIMYPCPQAPHEAASLGWMVPQQDSCPYCGAVLVPPEEEKPNGV